MGIEEQSTLKAKPKLTRPNKLKPGHIITKFASKQQVMNVWLQKRALVCIVENTAMTYVVCRGKTVVGYYSLAASSVSRAECSSALRRNSPDPVPAILLARLAVDENEEGQGIGSDLLRDAMLRSLSVSQKVAAKTLLVHALDDKVANFYIGHGFLKLGTVGGLITLHMPFKKIFEANLQATAK